MDAYLQILRKTTGLEWISEYRFHPPRRWRFDYACLELKIAVELNGGLFVRGRHCQPQAMLSEYEKINTAVSLGWRVLTCTPITNSMQLMRFGSEGFMNLLTTTINGRNMEGNK